MRPRRPSECISSHPRQAVDAKEALTQVVVTTPSADLAQTARRPKGWPMYFEDSSNSLASPSVKKQQLKVASIKGSQIDSPPGLANFPARCPGCKWQKLKGPGGKGASQLKFTHGCAAGPLSKGAEWKWFSPFQPQATMEAHAN